MIIKKWITGLLAALMVVSFTSPIGAVSYKQMSDAEFTADMMNISPEMRNFGVKKTDELMATINKTKLKQGVVEFTTPAIEIYGTYWFVDLMTVERNTLSRPFYQTAEQKTWTSKFDPKKGMILSLTLQYFSSKGGGRTLDKRELSWNPNTQTFSQKNYRQLMEEWNGDIWSGYEKEGSAYWIQNDTKPSVSPAPTTPIELKIPSKYFPAPTTNDAFKDIVGHWAKDHIQRAVKLGFIKGYTNGTFRPNNNITRAEFVTALVKALNLSPSNQASSFKDDQGWAEPYIQAAIEKGIIKVEEYNNGEFIPNQPITRQEIAVMAVRVMGKESEATNTDLNDQSNSNLIDLNLVDEPFRGYIPLAVKLGIIKGYQDRSFRPLNHATRSESFVVILNLLK